MAYHHGRISLLAVLAQVFIEPIQRISMRANFMTTHTDLFLTYLRHYAAKDLQAISAMFAEDIHLRDWNISVHGKEEAIRETAKNFAEAESLETRVLATYENADTIAGEIHIVVDGRIDLYVVDVVTFNSQDCITAIRSYKGRGD